VPWRTFTFGRHTGVPLEPRGLVADFDPSTGAFTLWISTQVPHMMQAVLAELFGLEEHRVRVIAPDVGGSFGIKIHVYQDDMAACALAIALGRPVKFVADRRESFLSDKGVGEAGTSGAPAAIVNAMNDALAPLGVVITQQPLTPERVWRAIADARAPGGPRK
jgi:CO/xanthine dehydrogenase Mo-binding subunit